MTQGARVVGLKYELIQEPAVAASPPAHAVQASRKQKPARRENLNKSFDVTIERTAVQKLELTVVATDKAKAEQQALEEAAHQEFHSAEITNKVKTVRLV